MDIDHVYVISLEKQLSDVSSQLLRDNKLLDEALEELNKQEAKGNKWQDEIRELKASLLEKEAGVRELKRALSERDVLVATLKADLASCRNAMQERDAVVGTLNGELASCRVAMQERELEIFAALALNVKLACGGAVKGDLGSLTERMQAEQWPRQEWSQRIRAFLDGAK